MTFLPAHHFFKVTVANIFTIEAYRLRCLLFVLTFFISTKDFIETHVTSFPAIKIVGVTFTRAIDNDLAIIILFLLDLFVLFLLDLFVLFLFDLFILLLFNFFFLFLLNIFFLFLINTIVVIIVIATVVTILNTITLATSAGAAPFTCNEIATI